MLDFSSSLGVVRVPGEIAEKKLHAAYTLWAETQMH